MPLIRYLNVDLEVRSRTSLEALERGFGDRAYLLAQRQEDGLFVASFEIAADHDDPETAIRAFCDMIEALPPIVRDLWDVSVQRSFDIGFDSGDEPFPFSTALTPATTARVARLRAGITVSIYPPEHTG
ncbi:MAG: hypothetical protein WD009_09315 [Phycisphaeraceae bacterium]